MAASFCVRCYSKPFLQTRVYVNRGHLIPTKAVMAAQSSAGVQEYIDGHGLQKTVEEVLNSCVKGKPEEPLSFMWVIHTSLCGLLKS